MPSQFLNIMKDLIAQAGAIALRNISDSQPSLKPDQSVLTKTDKEISALIRNGLADFLIQPNHILIDEEDEKRGEYLNSDILKSADYLWAIDPIDGTRLYANRMPHFGISIGLFKGLRPWLGMVYFPYLAELFYCDGEKSFFVQNAFTADEIKTQIKPVEKTITSQSIFLCNDNFSQHLQWDYKDCHLMMQSCAVVDFCWPAIGRSCGCITKSCLWDFAGSLPIALSAGLELRALATGKKLDHIDIEVFLKDKSPWKLKEYFILSTEKNFMVLKQKIKIRKNALCE